MLNQYMKYICVRYDHCVSSEHRHACVHRWTGHSETRQVQTGGPTLLGYNACQPCTYTIQQVISLLIDAKMLNEVLLAEFKNTSKNMSYQDPGGFTPEIQRCVNIWKSINKIHHTKRQNMKDRNHLPSHSMQQSFMIKFLERLGRQGMYLKIIKTITTSP